MDVEVYRSYALVALDENTEQQDLIVSLDYAGLVRLRNEYRAKGYTAFLDYSVEWDGLAANVTADVAAFLGKQS